MRKLTPTFAACLSLIVVLASGFQAGANDAPLRKELWKETVMSRMAKDPETAYELISAVTVPNPPGAVGFMDWAAKRVDDGKSIELPGRYRSTGHWLERALRAAKALPTPRQLRIKNWEIKARREGPAAFEAFAELAHNRLERAQEPNASLADRAFERRYREMAQAQQGLPPVAQSLNDAIRRAPTNGVIARVFEHYQSLGEAERKKIATDQKALRRYIDSQTSIIEGTLKEVQATEDQVLRTNQELLARLEQAQNAEAAAEAKRLVEAAERRQIEESYAAARTLGAIGALTGSPELRTAAVAAEATLIAGWAIRDLALNGFSFAATGNVIGAANMLIALGGSDVKGQQFDAIMQTLHQIQEQLVQIRMHLNILDEKLDRLSSQLASVELGSRRSLRRIEDDIAELADEFERHRRYEILRDVEEARGDAARLEERCHSYFRAPLNPNEAAQARHKEKLNDCLSDFFILATTTATDPSRLLAGESLWSERLSERMVEQFSRRQTDWMDYMGPISDLRADLTGDRVGDLLHPGLWHRGASNYAELSLAASSDLFMSEEEEARRIRELRRSGESASVVLEWLDSESPRALERILRTYAGALMDIRSRIEKSVANHADMMLSEIPGTPSWWLSSETLGSTTGADAFSRDANSLLAAIVLNNAGLIDLETRTYREGPTILENQCRRTGHSEQGGEYCYVRFRWDTARLRRVWEFRPRKTSKEVETLLLTAESSVSVAPPADIMEEGQFEQFEREVWSELNDEVLEASLEEVVSHYLDNEYRGSEHWSFSGESLDGEVSVKHTHPKNAEKNTRAFKGRWDQYLEEVRNGILVLENRAWKTEAARINWARSAFLLLASATHGGCPFSNPHALEVNRLMRSSGQLKRAVPDTKFEPPILGAADGRQMLEGITKNWSIGFEDWASSVEPASEEERDRILATRAKWVEDRPDYFEPLSTSNAGFEAYSAFSEWSGSKKADQQLRYCGKRPSISLVQLGLEYLNALEELRGLHSF